VLVGGVDLGLACYDEVNETESHIFIKCELSSVNLYGVFKWIDVMVVITDNHQTLLQFFEFGEKRERGKMFFLMIWHTAVWLIWNIRNEWIFNSKLSFVEEVLDAIKSLSWSWFLDIKIGFFMPILWMVYFTVRLYS